jgi:hypothetical protein
MKRVQRFRIWKMAAAALLAGLTVQPVWPEPTATATAVFDAYVSSVEARLAGDHASASRYLEPADPARLRRGEFVVEELTPAGGRNLGGALLHDWRGTAFVPGAKAGDFRRVMMDFTGYPRYFAPQIVEARVLSQQRDRFQVSMRVRQQHILTVVIDMAYDITFARVGPNGDETSRGNSISRSTRVAEIEAPGTAHERALPPGEDHGFLWRMNTYWSYEERDGGLCIQVESVSLTRSVPAGPGWAIDPFIESIPRESLEFTMRSLCKSLRR